MSSSWSFSNLWNRSLEKEPRLSVPRDRIWATELGGSYIDLYYKLKGHPFTNPPNARSMRKFEAGHIWEAIVKHILARAGLLISTQDYLVHQYEGLLPVTGRLDQLAGGSINWRKAKAYIKNELSWMPESIQESAYAVAEGLRAKYHSLELETYVLDVKSVSSYMFDMYETVKKPNPNHELQVFHYLKCKKINEGHLVYICRDDCRILEFPVYLTDTALEEKYRSYIAQITDYVKNGIIPPKEPTVVINEIGRFTKNWKIEYSNYLTMIYGFAAPIDYYTFASREAGRLNRVIQRIASGAKMTELNLATIEEIRRGWGQDKLNEMVEKRKTIKEEVVEE